MSNTQTFFVLVFLTIAFLRIFLYIRPTRSPKIGWLQIHHYMYGILGVPLAIVTHSLYLYSFSFGMIIDELTAYVLLRGESHDDNFSRASLAGTMAFLILTFMFREHLVPHLLHK